MRRGIKSSVGQRICANRKRAAAVLDREKLEAAAIRALRRQEEAKIKSANSQSQQTKKEN
jgi:hypothetical protein